MPTRRAPRDGNTGERFCRARYYAHGKTNMGHGAIGAGLISTLTLYLLWHRCRMRSAEQDVVEGEQKRGSFLISGTHPSSRHEKRWAPDLVSFKRGSRATGCIPRDGTEPRTP